jgi:hypothetical protein
MNARHRPPRLCSRAKVDDHLARHKGWVAHEAGQPEARHACVVACPTVGNRPELRLRITNDPNILGGAGGKCPQLNNRPVAIPGPVPVQREADEWISPEQVQIDPGKW